MRPFWLRVPDALTSPSPFALVSTTGKWLLVTFPPQPSTPAALAGAEARWARQRGARLEFPSTQSPAEPLPGAAGWPAGERPRHGAPGELLSCVSGAYQRAPFCCRREE